MIRRLSAAVVAAVLVGSGIRAAEPAVVAVVACDPYADLKKQIRWVGTLVDQPMLDALAESPLMMATNFKGLAGLDLTRPLGLVVTAAGDQPVVHAYLPVKDLDRLLDSLQAVTGPVEKAAGVRRIAPQGGMPLDIVERDGWAVVGPRGAAPPVADPSPLLADVVKPFTLGVQAFPDRMPEAMREQLRGQLEQAAAMSRARAGGAGGVGALLENIGEIESVLLGLAIAPEDEQVFVESRSRMVAGSKAAAGAADAARAAVTVATAPTADGKPPAVSAHMALAVPEAVRQATIDGLDAIEASDDSPAAARTAMAVVREALAAMIEAGGYDAAVSVDTSAVGDGERPVPAITAGMRVKDGAALEARVKKLVAAAGEVPGLTVDFDAGQAAGANLHAVTVEGLDVPGFDLGDEPLDLTLAVSPTYAWVLAGGDVPKRLAAVAAASGKPDATVPPMADVTVALGPLLRFAAAAARAADDEAADPAGLEAAAEIADSQKSLVQLLMRPAERGMSLRVSADAGAIRTVAASVKPQPRRPRPGVPATGGPDPIPFPVPVR